MALIIFLFYIIIICINLPAADALQQSSGELYGDTITIEADSSGYRVTAQGSAVIIYNDLKITGDTAHYITETEEIICKGSVEVTDSNYQITGERLEGILSRSKFEITNQVVFKSKDLEIKAGLLSFNEENKSVIMRESPSLVYSNLEAAADKITYDMAEKVILLEGNVRGKRNGQNFAAAELEIDVENEKIELRGQAKITISDRGENK